MWVKFGGSHNSKKCKKRSKETQKNAHFGEAIILPTTKVASIIIT
jgi:hypothetical protein